MTFDAGRIRHDMSLMHYARASNGTAIPSNWLASTDGTTAVLWRPETVGGGSVSYGSNTTDVAEVAIGGALTTVSRSDHYHSGIKEVSSSSSNTLQRGKVNFRSGANVGLTATDTDGDGEFDTITIHSTGGAAAGGGGGSLTQAFVGYNTIGGTWEIVTSFRQYCKTVTLANACLLTSIDLYVRQSNDNIEAIAATVLTDNGGNPDELIAYSMSPSGQLYLSVSATMPGPGRWLSMPIGAWLPAGTYWICFMGSINRFDIAYDAGSDTIFTASQYLATGAYPSAWALSNSSRKYSIRANTIR